MDEHAETAMYERVMTMWRVPFHIIENEWTDDQFFAMVDRAVERGKEEQKEQKKAERQSGSKPSSRGGVETRNSSYSISELVAHAATN